VGGALVFLATFLPLGRADYPATSGDAALTILSVPAHDLVTIWGFNLRQPDAGFVSTSIETLLLWGVPTALLGIGVALAAPPGWTPTWRARASTVGLAVIGASFLGISCWGYLTPIFGYQGAVRTLEYGAGVAALGYACALGGAIGLAALPRSGQR
jgi:hypothetical protein